MIRQKNDNAETVRRYGPGDLVGSCALFGQMPRLFTVQAGETTEALRLCRQQFHKTMGQFPGAMEKTAANLVAELTRWDQALLAEQEKQGLSSAQKLGVSLI